MNGDPCEEVEEVSHPFTAEVMPILILDKCKLPTMPLYDWTTDPDDYLKRILIDNGSLIDILYQDIFTTMVLTQEQMVVTARCLYGFTGDSITLEGMISLPIIFGTRSSTVTVRSNFLIVKDDPSAML